MQLAERLDAVTAAASLEALDELRVGWLGKKGEITEQLKALGSVPAEQRKERGRELNELRSSLAEAIEAKQAALTEAQENARLAEEKIDVTLPVFTGGQGTVHPITQVMDEVIAIFAEMGFSVRTGPLVEDDEHNFGALNIPESHPARQMHDTFYVRGSEETEETPGSHVLRTHTSPVQIRTMRGEKPPIRIIAPGSTFRNDSDLTHTPMFHQAEGLVIEQGIHMGHLKGIIRQFLERFFGIESLPVRFRPSFFPFTEPSAEVDIGCTRSRESLKVGVGPDWLEIMGCGMVHPNVLTNCGLDPAEWQGFAFGMGIERLAMLKYNIPDLRTFYGSDVRWLKSYGFSGLERP